MDRTAAGRPAPLEIVGAAAGYLLLVAALTWPLAAALTTHWPSTSIFAMRDLPVQASVLAHEADSLLHDPAALPHAPFFHPSRWTLFYGEAAFGALPIFLVPYALTRNPVLALNVVFLAGVTLTAAALYAVARRWGARPVAAALAGLFFVVNPWTVWVWGVDAPGFTVLWLWPVVIALAAADAPPVGRLAAALALQAITSVYVAVGLFVVFGTVVLVRLLAGERAAAVRLAAAGAIATVPTALVLGWHLVLRWIDPGLDAQHPPPIEIFQSGEHLFDSLRPGVPTAVPLGTAALVVAGTLLVRRRTAGDRRRWRHLLAWAGASFLIALPAKVVLLHHELPSPMRGVAALGSSLVAIRDSHRLGLGFLPAMGLASALATEWIGSATARRAGRRTGALVVGLTATLTVATMVHQFRGRVVVITRPPALGAFPIRRVDAPDDAAVRAALQRIPGPVLELPIDPLGQAAAMLRATRDGHPTLDGTHSYFPAGFAERMRAACALPAPEAVASLSATAGLAAIVVEPDALDRDGLNDPPFGCASGSRDAAQLAAGRRAQWEAAASGRSDLALVARTPRVLVFRVVAPSEVP